MVENGANLHIMFTRDLTLGGPLRAPVVPLAKSASTSSNLLYNGGPIQTAPKIYVVFWGSAWNGSGDPDGMAAYLVNFLKAAAGSKWLNSVTQYYQSDGQHVGNSSISVSSWTDTGSNPPSRPRQSNIASEASRAASHFGDHSVSASYVIVSPHGIKPQGFGTQYCAWHSSTSTSGGTIAYTNLPYIPDAGAACGVGSVNNPGTLDGVSIVGGHEQAETETDPQPNTGWLDSSGAENGDKCAWTNLINNANAGGYPTQPLWSNATSSCVQSY
jgi:serine protease